MEYIRSGSGPALIEAEVVRLLSHSSSDDQKKYRDGKELEEDLKNDPIEKFSKILISENKITKEEIDKIWKEAAEEVNSVADKAQKMPDPDPAKSDWYVFDDSGTKDKLEYEKSEPSGKKIVMVDAINHALHEEAEANDKIYIFGQDIADKKGGVFTATKGLSQNLVIKEFLILRLQKQVLLVLQLVWL